jgi:multicomponent Na+:H+ antiporter subunit E
MNFLLINIVLMLSWAMLNGEITPGNLLAGFVLGYLMLALTQRALGTTVYTSKFVTVISFAGYFLWELFKSNIRVAVEVLTPGNLMKPGIVAVPLTCQRDLEIILLANLITLTPGTLSIDVSDDKQVLYVHSMYIDDVEEFRESIKNGFEKRILELFA